MCEIRTCVLLYILTNATMYCTQYTTSLASMAYISNNSLFTLIFFINFALWDIFLPEDPFPAAYIEFDCYKLHIRQVVDVYV